MADAEQWRPKVQGAEAGLDKNGDIAESSQEVVEEEIVELEFEKAKQKLTMHSMHCPKCKSEITKIVYHQKMLADTNSTPDLVGCPSCLSLFTCSVSLSGAVKLISFISSDPRSPASRKRQQEEWFEAEYLRSLRVVATTKDSTQLDPKIAEEKFVPDWHFSNKDTVVAPDSAKLFLYNLGTPADYLRFRSLGDSDISDQAMVNQAHSNLLTSELHRRWVEAKVENTNLRRQLQPNGAKEELNKSLDNATADEIAHHNAEEILVKTKAALEELQTRIDDFSKLYNKQANIFAGQAAEIKEWKENVADKSCLGFRSIVIGLFVCLFVYAYVSD